MLVVECGGIFGGVTPAGEVPMRIATKVTTNVTIRVQTRMMMPRGVDRRTSGVSGLWCSKAQSHAGPDAADLFPIDCGPQISRNSR